jgi:8-oxo-dGTP pyrophosphatase MutT (NUDIX family)
MAMGDDSHETLLFLNRLETIGLDQKDMPHHSSLNRASVLVPLFFVNEKPFLLLNLRSQKLKSHKGEVCFPGGKQDPQDGSDDLVTALREAQEEVGLDPALVQPLCRLRTLESVNHLCVTPIVGRIANVDAVQLGNLQLSQAEVEAAFWCPLAFFATEPAEQFEVEWSQEMFVFRKYVYKESSCGRVFSITGLTAHIAHEVAELYQRDSTMTMTNVSESDVSPSLLNANSNLWNERSGYLYKQERSTATNRPFWTRKFFVVTDQRILHQYDSEEQAQKKAGSATKKNRLLLHDDVQVVFQEDKDTDTGRDDDDDDDSNKHTFQVLVLDGRIEWVLAAATREERTRWKQVILLCSVGTVNEAQPPRS